MIKQGTVYEGCQVKSDGAQLYQQCAGGVIITDADVPENCDPWTDQPWGEPIKPGETHKFWIECRDTATTWEECQVQDACTMSHTVKLERQETGTELTPIAFSISLAILGALFLAAILINASRHYQAEQKRQYDPIDEPAE